MFYETAQTVGPGWHRSYKPSHYEDMTWSPSAKPFRSPGSSPETYRRIIHTDEDFPKRSNSKDSEDEFFSRRSPTFPRRIFKEVWSESPPGSSNHHHRFGDRPRLFKRVFKPSWDEDFDDRDTPHIRRVDRSFDHDFDDMGRPLSRNFDEEFEKRFNARDLKKDIEEEFQKAEGRVHHIPIMVEKRMEEMKSRFGGKNNNSSPTPSAEHTSSKEGEEYSEEWLGPQVHNLRKNFEQPEEDYSSKYRHRYPKMDVDPSISRHRAFSNPINDTWDPHAVHTLPTRKVHKNSQSFDDSRHPVNPTPKSVFRSYSETHEDLPKQQSQQHSAAFRSHSDGHCPTQTTYVTKIEVNIPSRKEKEELRSRFSSNEHHQDTGCKDKASTEKLDQNNSSSNISGQQESNSCTKPAKTKSNKHECNPSLQQIAVILQNVEDLVVRVEAYNGTGRDKQYRFLDEMLTRCMLRLDDIDTEGRDDIRSARKAAVREVQSCIDKLEAKAEESERRNQQQMLPEREQIQQQDLDARPNNEDSENKERENKEEKEQHNSNNNNTADENQYGGHSSNTQEEKKENLTSSDSSEQTKL